jgi:hypothetical protein
MRPVTMVAAIAVAAIAVLAYPLARHAPASPAGELTRVADNDTCPGQEQDAPHRGVSEISWFQGTLEEAFARHSHSHSHHRPTALFDF